MRSDGIPLKGAMENKLIDTMKLSRKKIDDVSSYGLVTIAKYFSIEYDRIHRALDDCKTAYRIYEKLKEI